MDLVLLFIVSEKRTRTDEVQRALLALTSRAFITGSSATLGNRNITGKFVLPLSLQYHRVNEQRLRLSFGLLAQSPHSCTVVRPCPAPTENNCEALIDLTWVLDWAH